LSIQIWYSKPHSSLVISNPKPFYVHLEKTGVHIVQAPTPTPVPVEPTRKPDSMAAAATPTPVPLETPPSTPTVTVIRYRPASSVTDTTFTREVLQSPGPVMAFFWASWCGYCRKAAPAVDEASGRFGEKIKIVKINVDKNKLTASKYGVRGIPDFILFKDGKIIGRQKGFSNKQHLFSFIQQYL
jgi:thioredoxin 1